MADRIASKAKKPTKKLTGKSAKGAAVSAAGRDRTGELEAECGRLRAELETAAKRIASLEAQQRQLLDRIDWAIDSLRSLRD
jgi:chromosome segregation ATPase